MAVTYKQILRQAAIRIGDAGSIVGSDEATVETNYNSASFGAAEIDNPAFPYSAQVDALLLAEEKIAQIISSIKDHPLRNFLRGISGPLANRAQLPKADSAGDKVVGVIGAVYDATDLTQLTDEKTIQQIERIRRLGVSFLKKPYYFYQTTGATIIHTRSGNVIAEVCKYNKTTQLSAITSGAAMLFPDAMEEMLVCGEISYLFRQDESPETVKHYIEYFNSSCRRLEGGQMPE